MKVHVCDAGRWKGCKVAWAVAQHGAYNVLTLVLAMRMFFKLGVASRDHISIFAKLCWLLRKHGRRGDDDQGNHSYHGVLGCRGGSRQAAWPSFGEPFLEIEFESMVLVDIAISDKQR